MPGRALTGALLLLTGLCVPGVSAAEQDSTHGPALEPNPTERTASYVAVFGAVVNPGVYEFPAGPLEIADIIRQAGGSTDDASGNVRIVRDGRLVRQMFDSGRWDLQLFSGDIVAIDSRSTNSQPPEAVQLAFHGLIDRPVVVRMRPEHATVKQIVALLGQSSEVESTVQVLPSSSRSRGHAISPHQHNETLPSGTVLVFNPAVIRADRVPSLPGVYRVREEGDQTDAAPREALEALDAPALSADVETITPAPVHPGVPTPPSDATTGRAVVQPPDWNRRLTSRRPAAALLAEQVDSSNGSSSDSKSSTDQAASSSAEPDSSPASLSEATANLQETSDSRGPKIEKTAHPSFHIPRFSSFTDVGRLAVGGVVAVVVLAGLILLVSMSRRSHPSPASPATTARTASLEALIHNALPLTEQPLRLPKRLQLYGSPSGQRTLRIDAAHQLQTPNYQPTDPTFQTVVRPDGLPPDVPHRHNQDDAVRNLADEAAGGPTDIKRPYSLKKQTEGTRPVFTSGQGGTER